MRDKSTDTQFGESLFYRLHEPTNTNRQLSVYVCRKQLWGGTNNNQSDVVLNYCCSRESETLHQKNEGVQWYSET
ncbi:hypothetical protein TNCV_3573681 [Trichonephila clavipes]|nr:hypothetical protein TNCV_3573681 [Trichonephila clavipes]